MPYPNSGSIYSFINGVHFVISFRLINHFAISLRISNALAEQLFARAKCGTTMPVVL